MTVPRSYLHYDVFTSTPLAGNQLAVFLDGRGLAETHMQAIAREMNFSESTFILPPDADGTDTRMRIFTPGTELPMAGHPTIGSAFALAHAGTIAPGTRRFTFGLGIGPTPVDLEWEGSRLRFAWMTQLNPSFGAPLDDRQGTAAALGLATRDVVADLPVQVVSCGVPYLLVPLRDAATVDRAEVDVSTWRRFVGANALAIDTCFFVFAVSDPSDTHAPTNAYSRMFAPGFGITEDAATGSASGPLGCYLVRHGLVQGEAAQRIVSIQGVAMGRPSRIHIAITEYAGAITQVKVGGQAVLVARGELVA